MSTVKREKMDQIQDSVETFAASRDNFQTVWKNLGQPFWIKFITNTRYNVDIIDSKYNPHEFDYVFVEVLKNLVAKKFGKMFEYLVNVKKLVECQIDIRQLLQTNYLQTKTAVEKQEYYNIFKSLFGDSYTEIHSEKIKYIFDLHCTLSKKLIHILKAQDKDVTSFKFEIPSCWCEDNCSAGPYEMFLRARWGGELSKILDCKTEELTWWHAPAATSKTSLSQPFNGALKLIYETPCNWLPSISDYPPLNVTSVSETHNLDFFSRLKVLKVPSYMWDLIELSVPPVLARKFYLGKGGVLVEDDDEHHYLAICPWFVLWQNSFGIEYMSVIQSMHHEYEKNGINSTDEDLTWEERILLYKNVSSTALSKYGAPYKLEECAESPEEFLIEPCFLIQLTYSPVLLQQWLAGALLEALKFDLASLEIRHFPIPVDSEPLACKILIINKQLKERILLGMCLLSQQVARHPEFDETFAVKLMDEVIMPAVPALEFIISGKANKALRHFKRVLFTRTRSTVERGMLTVPEITYTIHKDLANIYVHHPFHIRYWLQDSKMFEPFPAKICENLDIDQVIKEIKSVEYDDIEASKFTFQNYSVEEKSFFSDRKNELSKVTPQVALQITTDLLKNKIKKEYFAKSESELDDIILPLETDDFTIQDDPSKLSLVHQAVQSVIMLQDISNCMIDMEKNPSWLSWVVRLSGEVLKKEQLIRLVTTCALILEETPNISAQLSIHASKPYEIKTVVTKTLKAQKLRNVSWLEKQFPDAWTNPIISPSLQLNPEEHRTLGDIVQTMEDRVGRLIYNVAMRYMKEGPESSSKYEALFSAQYLLPCYMSIHFCGNLQILFFRNPLKCAVLSNFLITVIIRYECYYKIEARKKKLKERFTGIELSQSDNINVLPQSFSKEVLMASERVSSYLYERVNDFFAEYQAVDMIKIMYESMFDWPNYATNNKELCRVEGLILKAWQIVGTDHLRDARENCRQAWNLPKPGCSLNNKDLKSVYHASEVIARLSILTCRFGGDYPGLKKLREYELLRKIMKILPTWRHDLLVRVLYTQNAIGISDDYATMFTDNDISTFCKNYTDLLSKVLGLMRRCREYLGYTLNTVISPNLGYESSHVTNHILDFNLGNLDNIFKSLRLKHSCKGDAQTELDIRDMALKYLNITIEPAIASSSGKQSKKTAKKKLPPLESKEEEKPGVQCRNCQKFEPKKGKFLACEKCVKDKYPDINYFCDSTCRTMWWEIEHMAEHLEFELGLC